MSRHSISSPSQLALIITSFATKKSALIVIRCLVKERLAACGTMIPKAVSIYSWKGKIEESKEVVILLKTTQALRKSCMKRLNELHPYDVPEIIVIKPTDVGEGYLNWLQQYLS